MKKRVEEKTKFYVLVVGLISAATSWAMQSPYPLPQGQQFPVLHPHEIAMQQSYPAMQSPYPSHPVQQFPVLSPHEIAMQQGYPAMQVWPTHRIQSNNSPCSVHMR